LCPVERFNPHKTSALKFKRERERDGRSGRSVAIREVTLSEARSDALEFGLATDIFMQLKSGKEASLYIASWRGHPIVLKAYRFWHTSHASKKRGWFAPARMEALAAKEYDVLMAAFRAGMPVPTPIGRVANYLTMRFIGDGLVPAPRLKDMVIEKPESVFEQIVDDYLTMYSVAHYVHGDLSPYNLLWWRGKAWFIDMPQAYAVDTWCNMKRVIFLLERDIRNIVAYFEKYGLIANVEEIVDRFLGCYVPENQMRAVHLYWSKRSRP